MGEICPWMGEQRCSKIDGLMDDGQEILVVGEQTVLYTQGLGAFRSSFFISGFIWPWLKMIQNQPLWHHSTPTNLLQWVCLSVGRSIFERSSNFEPGQWWNPLTEATCRVWHKSCRPSLLGRFWGLGHGKCITWMSQEVSKWFVNGLQPTCKWGILGVITHLLTIDILTSWDMASHNSLGRWKMWPAASFAYKMPPESADASSSDIWWQPCAQQISTLSVVGLGRPCQITI